MVRKDSRNYMWSVIATKILKTDHFIEKKMFFIG